MSSNTTSKHVVTAGFAQEKPYLNKRFNQLSKLSSSSSSLSSLSEQEPSKNPTSRKDHEQQDCSSSNSVRKSNSSNYSKRGHDDNNREAKMHCNRKYARENRDDNRDSPNNSATSDDDKMKERSSKKNKGRKDKNSFFKRCNDTSSNRSSHLCSQNNSIEESEQRQGKENREGEDEKIMHQHPSRKKQGDSLHSNSSDSRRTKGRNVTTALNDSSKSLHPRKVPICGNNGDDGNDDDDDEDDNDNVVVVPRTTKRRNSNEEERMEKCTTRSLHTSRNNTRDRGKSVSSNDLGNFQRLSGSRAPIPSSKIEGYATTTTTTGLNRKREDHCRRHNISKRSGRPNNNSSSGCKMNKSCSSSSSSSRRSTLPPKKISSSSSSKKFNEVGHLDQKLTCHNNKATGARQQRLNHELLQKRTNNNNNNRNDSIDVDSGSVVSCLSGPSSSSMRRRSRCRRQSQLASRSLQSRIGNISSTTFHLVEGEDKSHRISNRKKAAAAAAASSIVMISRQKNNHHHQPSIEIAGTGLHQQQAKVMSTFNKGGFLANDLGDKWYDLERRSKTFVVDEVRSAPTKDNFSKGWI